MNTPLGHEVYQNRLQRHLEKWPRRRSRPLPPQWLEAGLILLRLDLDPLRPLLTSLYSPSPRGHPPFDPVSMTRALLLMSLLGLTSIDRFAQDLRRSPRLARMAGFEPFHTPAVGTFYLFLDRLEDGPYQPACPHRLKPSDQRRASRRRHFSR